jgi:hypothetical protein
MLAAKDPMSQITVIRGTGLADWSIVQETQVATRGPRELVVIGAFGWLRSAPGAPCFRSHAVSFLRRLYRIVREPWNQLHQLLATGLFSNRAQRLYRSSFVRFKTRAFI